MLGTDQMSVSVSVWCEDRWWRSAPAAPSAGTASAPRWPWRSLCITSAAGKRGGGTQPVHQYAMWGKLPAAGSGPLLVCCATILVIRAQAGRLPSEIGREGPGGVGVHGQMVSERRIRKARALDDEVRGLTVKRLVYVQNFITNIPQFRQVLHSQMCFLAGDLP